jgi:hypothetical protein
MRILFMAVLLILADGAFAQPRPQRKTVRFIENKKQWPREYRFSADVQAGKIMFASDRVVFSFLEKKIVQNDKQRRNVPHALPMDEAGNRIFDVNGHLYQLIFVNANPHPKIFGEGDTGTRFNYFLGNDTSRWASDAASYYNLYYEKIYNGIDLRYYSDKGNMKYEWIVAPQADPGSIVMKYDGVTTLTLQNENLYIETSVNEIWEMKPFAYQVINGRKVPVKCRYDIRNNVVTYSMPEGYDVCEELIIDPILIFSAYSGSTLDNWGNTATYDHRGNVYSGGIVTNTGFQLGYPVTPGAYQTQYKGGEWDVGILKFDSAGSKLMYCTYLGGNDTETPQSLVTDKDGNLLILGTTGSPNFPVTNGSTFQGGEDIDPLWGIPYSQGSDIFIAKLSSDGTQLLGGTYLGGTENDGVNFISGYMFDPVNKVESPLGRNYGDQLRGDIICDQDGFVYVASNTRSNDIPGMMNVYGGGSHEALLVKFQPDLSAMMWGRYIGGTGTDIAYSVKLDKSNNVYVAGGTTSASLGFVTGFKTVNQGNGDGWIMSLTNDGSTILHGTFLGTAQYDQSYFIDINSDDEIFAYGQTLGDYAPGQTGRQFIHKLSHDLTTSMFIRLVGPGTISPTAFLVSDCGYIYISGWGGSINSPKVGNITRNYIGGSTIGLPVTPDAFQPDPFGDDFYFLVVSADGMTNLYGTFLGGPASPTHVDGGTSRFDKLGIVYHAVCAGCHGESDFPAVNAPPGHTQNGSQLCNNAVFKFDLSLLKARLQTNTVQLDHPGISDLCLGDDIVFQNKCNGGETFEWDLGDDTEFTTTDTARFVHRYQRVGTYKVWLKAIDRGTCKVKDSTFTFVYVHVPNVKIKGDATICENTSWQLEASGGTNYLWRSEDGSFVSVNPSPMVSPLTTTRYFVTVSEENGCIHKDTVDITVTPTITPEFSYKHIGDCSSVPSVSVENLTQDSRPGDNVYFDFGDGHTSDEDATVHEYERNGDFLLKLVTEHHGCVTEKSVPLGIHALKIPNVITPGAKEKKNDTFSIQLGENPTLTPASYGLNVDLVIYNRWGREVYRDANYEYNWSAEGLEGGIYYYELTVDSYSTCKGWIHVLK